MTVKTTGPLSFDTDIVGEFKGSRPHSLSEYYSGGTLVSAGTKNAAGNVIPSSGTIKFSDFYGASNKPWSYSGTAEEFSANGKNFLRIKTSGSLTVSVTLPNVLLIGGGGAGGVHAGGGAGGFLTGTNISAGTYAVVIGDGGKFPSDIGTLGTNGGNTTAFGLTAIGGGGAGGDNHGGANGGSGGGGSSGDRNYMGAGGKGTAGQGNDGGAGYSFSGWGNVGGGGGGAGGPGHNAVQDDHPIPSGGDGKAWIDGNIYAGGGGSGKGRVYAGGTSGNLGGSNIGGNGGGGPTGIGLSSGAPNTGSGGGGISGDPATAQGRKGDGGSGVIVIELP